MWMNQWDVEDAIQRYNRHEVLGPAVRTLGNLMEWTNNNSDGWAYWPKPSKAASKLMALIYPSAPFGVTVTDVNNAMRPIKAFRTRHGADFKIEEV